MSGAKQAASAAATGTVAMATSSPIFAVPRSGTGSSGGRHPLAQGEWPMVDIDQGLAASLEGSLSGLGVDLSVAAFSMSDAIISLSPRVNLGRFASSDGGSESSNFSALERQLDCLSSSGGNIADCSRLLLPAGRLCFSLSAGTSPAVRANEEPLTYLNQGQPYEVKMTYASPDEKPRLLKSIFRVSFHDRRMQFMEKEHLDYWRQSRPGERFLDVDAALAYSIRQVIAHPDRINSAEVVWEAGGGGGGSGGGGDGVGGQLPTSDCGVFVRLHCVSTEFTARKHGGEKGVPFRLQIDTHDCATGELVCSVAAQVKVFKPKGADRKHKADRDKAEKRSPGDRTKYQPALAYTPFMALLPAAASEQRTQSQRPPFRQSSVPVKLEALGCGECIQTTAATAAASGPHSSPPEKPEVTAAAGIAAVSQSPASAAAPSAWRLDSPSLDQWSSVQQVADWLQRCRYPTRVVRAFQRYDGADLLKLTRADLLEICGPADGVRLANALRRRPCRPKLLVFVGQEAENMFHPVYLSQLTYSELFTKITGLFQADAEKITQILAYGPAGISVCISDEMVSHMGNESKYTLHVLADLAHPGMFKIFLKECRTFSGDLS